MFGRMIPAFVVAAALQEIVNAALETGGMAVLRVALAAADAGDMSLIEVNARDTDGVPTDITWIAKP